MSQVCEDRECKCQCQYCMLVFEGWAAKGRGGGASHISGKPHFVCYWPVWVRVALQPHCLEEVTA